MSAWVSIKRFFDRTPSPKASSSTPKIQEWEPTSSPARYCPFLVPHFGTITNYILPTQLGLLIGLSLNDHSYPSPSLKNTVTLTASPAAAESDLLLLSTSAAINCRYQPGFCPFLDSWHSVTLFLQQWRALALSRNFRLCAQRQWSGRTHPGLARV